MPSILCVVTVIRFINAAHHIDLFDIVFDLSGLFNRYPSYQRPNYGGNGFGQGPFYQNPGYGQSGIGGFGNNYPGSGLGTNVLGNKL